MLLSAGFRISEDMVAVAWIRCDPAHKLFLRTSLVSSDSHAFSTEACPSEGSRYFLPPMVRTRMKELCNEVCPRDDDGVFLAKRSVGRGEKRPAWFIAKIMQDLKQEFHQYELKGVQEKAMRFISRTSQVDRRLTTLTDQDWTDMLDVDRTRNAALLKKIEDSHESWRKSPYGSCWVEQGMRRQPTIEELQIIAKRNFVGMTIHDPAPK